jgi:hypothetical protein
MMLDSALEPGCQDQPARRIACDGCDEAATHECLSPKCADEPFLCGTHLDEHKRHKKKKSHETKPIGDGASTARAATLSSTVGLEGAKLQPVAMCELHSDQQLGMFCTTCQLLVCGACLVKTHRGPTHRVIEVGRAEANAKCALRRSVDESAKAVERVVAVSQQLAARRGTLESSAATLVTAVREQFRTIRRSLVKREAELVEDVAAKLAAELAASVARTDALDSAREHAEHVEALCQAALSRADVAHSAPGFIDTRELIALGSHLTAGMAHVHAVSRHATSEAAAASVEIGLAFVPANEAATTRIVAELGSWAA